jgi:hypothetical protein
MLKKITFKSTNGLNSEENPAVIKIALEATITVAEIT